MIKNDESQHSSFPRFRSKFPSLTTLYSLFIYLPNLTGGFKFERIGSPYDAMVPVTAMRMVPAFFGSLMMPTVYNLLVELGLSHYTGALAAFLLIFGEYLSIADLCAASNVEEQYLINFLVSRSVFSTCLFLLHVDR